MLNYVPSRKDTDYYKTNKDKIIKIQSLIRMKYWYLHYIKNINSQINKLYQRKNKEYVHEPTIFGDNSKENIKALEIVFKQKQKKK